jgi:hypothetical protein
MAYTIEQYNTLCAAIAQGAQSVKYADKEVTYMSPDQMKRIKREMEVELGLQKASSRTRYAQHSKGLK